MKLLRITARVYDGKAMEYVQRINEVPITDEIAKALQDAIWNDRSNGCPIHGYGHGDTRYDKRYCEGVSSTPLRDQRRFQIDPIIQLIEVDEQKGEKVIGGWSGI